ncbi:hypothetical protein BC940DRAFT_288290 [Gongronella butleri]|nr:hypothetical protein BC940DRAFT_288290 [Gongronella butleri]
MQINTMATVACSTLYMLRVFGATLYEMVPYKRLQLDFWTMEHLFFLSRGLTITLSQGLPILSWIHTVVCP